MKKLKLIKEALGVPNGLVRLAIKFYDDFIKKISDNDNFESLNGKKIEMLGQFIVGDYFFNKAEISLFLIQGGKISTKSFNNVETFQINKDFKNITTSNIIDKTGYGFKLKIYLNAPKDVTGAEIKNYFEINKNNAINFFGHELKHRYDLYKKSTSKIKDSVDYDSNIKFESHFGIYPLNKFFYFLYYIDFVENLVRTSEVATNMETMGISKRDFLNYIMSTQVVQILKAINNFTFDGLQQELKSFIPEIKKWGYQPNDTDEEIIRKFLKKVYMEVSYTKKQIYAKMISNPNEFKAFESTQKFPDELRNEVLKDYMSKSDSKYRGDYLNFFKSSEQELKNVSNKLLRKIFKLYALASDIKDRKYPQSFDRMINNKSPRPLSTMMNKKY
jgi:hypothetical protein